MSFGIARVIYIDYVGLFFLLFWEGFCPIVGLAYPILFCGTIFASPFVVSRFFFSGGPLQV